MTAFYIGRFAPSPTGPLHFGSLLAAIASYCDAKAQKGKWLLRIEDIDKPREVKGAANDIIQSLATFGFEWDDEIIYQSNRTEYYQQALQALIQQNLIYPCTCSRKEIADSSLQNGIEGAIYPKTCLNHPIKPHQTPAFRIQTQSCITTWTDNIQGNMAQNIAEEIGDFVLQRTDGIHAYQLAVVVDDAMQGVTHVVRGADLLNSTARQIYLQQLLHLNRPAYAHIPVVVNAQGEKLSKQTLARPIILNDTSQQIFTALTFLGQNPPTSLKNSQPKALLAWAISHWKIRNIPKHRTATSVV